MGAARYKIMLVHAKTKKEQLREWSAAELVRSVAWLKRMNARGHDVLIAPAGQHGLVLLDGLREEMPTAMSGKGFEPVATIQTGPGRYQAWIKLSDRSVPDEVRQHARNGLKHAFGSHITTTERIDYGSLAGFTCDKIDKGGKVARRFVLIHHAGGAVAKEASALMETIRAALEPQAMQRQKNPKEEPKLTSRHRSPSR